jgi:hypothetical protein
MIALGACFVGPWKQTLDFSTQNRSLNSPVIQQSLALNTRVAHISALQSVEAVPHSTL